MNSSDPIRLSAIREMHSAAPAFSRLEAQRQFRFSVALLAILTLATLAAVVGWDNGNGAMVTAATVR